jgi:hypothetical protein
MAEEIGEDVPNADDFFGNEQKKEAEPTNANNLRKSMILP